MGVGDPGLQLGFFFGAQRDPVGEPRLKPPGRKMPPLDPVVDHAGTDAQPIGHLSDRQLLSAFLRRHRNVIPVAHPLDHTRSEALAFGTENLFLIEGGANLRIGHAQGQRTHPVHQRLRITDPVGCGQR